MALHYLSDRLCAICGSRFAAHSFYSALSNYYCPEVITGQWKNESKVFVDSGKLRSRFCDRRNNPLLYWN